jgi:hypothetical protein
VSEFVEECRREWRRLGVPDPIANEMAADLTADIEEAEDEGASPEDVLGNSAFDPRRFAASWAVARGVTAPPTVEGGSLWRQPLAIALAVALTIVTLVGGLALFGGGSSSVAVATRRIAIYPGPARLFSPGTGQIVIPGGPPFTRTQVASLDIHPIASVLFLVGLVGLALLVLFSLSPWSGPRRGRGAGWRDRLGLRTKQ